MRAWNHFTVRETLQQNGVPERMNNTLLGKLRCMLSNASLPKYSWAEALAYACYLFNRLSSSVIGGKTLLEAWSERVAQDYDSLHVFESPTYYHIKEDKLGPRARKIVFMGFKKGVKCYKFWYLKDKKFVLSRNFIFDETWMMKPTNSQQVESETTERISQQAESDAISMSLERSVSF